MPEVVSRIGLLDELRRLAKKGASVEASVITTFALNGLFYEEVLLRALERAGSRLNILLVDARQLAVAFQDPITRPRRAGRDYLLIPVDAGGAFHPKIALLFSPKSPLIAVGSHNVTDSGYARNDEVTVCWGHNSNGVPRDILEASLAFIIDWARTSPGLEELVDEVARRLSRVSNETAIATTDEAAFIGWRLREPSLLHQLKQRVPGPARRISIVSPYFDDNLKLLEELAIGWSPQEMVVGIQQQSTMLLRPERAPSVARFVEFSAPRGDERSDDLRQLPFLHGKVVAIETIGGLYVVVGSPNASSPAWLQGEVAGSNAEAAIVLGGGQARIAFEALGLDQMANAPPLSPAALVAVAGRTQEMRRIAEQVSGPSIPTLSAVATEVGWILPGLNAKDCRSAVLMARYDLALPDAKFRSHEGGAEVLFESQINGRCIRIDGEEGPLAYAILNDAIHLRKLLRPREAGRLLEALGRINDYEGFDSLFDLFERHVLGVEPVPQPAKARSVGQTSSGATPDDGQTTPGPRGISLASLSLPAKGRPQLDKDDFIADFLKALIRDLAQPALPQLDGDQPDIDEEDLDPNKRQGSKSVGALSLPPGEWERLVTTCRRRISVLIGRLSKRLSILPTGPTVAVSRAGKVLTVICLLQKLRMMRPPEGTPLVASGRPESLVANSQLRLAFKVGMRAMYSSGGLAEALEINKQSRGSEDRRLLDAVMLWTAREIGVDFDAEATFNEDPTLAFMRHQDRVDGLVASISAAAHANEPNSFSELPVWPWADAPKLGAGWMTRHIALGTAFQAHLTRGGLPTLQRPVADRDIVVWRKEPHFPRLVVALAPKRASLLEPGDQAGSELIKVQPDFLLAIDFLRLRGQATAL